MILSKFEDIIKPIEETWKNLNYKNIPMKNKLNIIMNNKKLIHKFDDDIDNFKNAQQQNPAYVPIPLKLKLNQEEVAVIASHQYKFPGISIKARLMRYYPLGEIGAHVVGYVGRINEQELQSLDSVNYRATNFIGTTGIENVSDLQIMEVYPNPVVSLVEVQIGCKQSADATLKLIDILGRTSLEQKSKLASGQNTVELDMTKLAAGVYQLVIQTGSEQAAYKIVKAK